MEIVAVATAHLSGQLAIVLVAALVAAATDLWKFRVYNLLTIPLLFTGLAYHAWYGGFVDSLVAALIGFGFLIVLHVMGGVGAGDVKLMAGVGAWLGTMNTIYVFIGSSLAAGVYSLALILINRRLFETLIELRILVHRLSTFGQFLASDDRFETEVTRPDRRSRVIPFGAMVAVGVIATLFYLQNH
jgi:prepilin peptidase CpaA